MRVMNVFLPANVIDRHIASLLVVQHRSPGHSQDFHVEQRVDFLQTSRQDFQPGLAGSIAGVIGGDQVETSVPNALAAICGFQSSGLESISGFRQVIRIASAVGIIS